MLLLQHTLRRILVVGATYEVCSVVVVVAAVAIDTGHTVPVRAAIRIVQASRRVARVRGIVVVARAVYVVKILAAVDALVVGQLVLDDLVAEWLAEVERLQHGIYIASIAKLKSGQGKEMRLGKRRTLEF